MAEALNELPISDTIKSALLGEENRAGLVLQTVVAYERANWEEASRNAERAGIPMNLLPERMATHCAGRNEMKQPRSCPERSGQTGLRR
jgi:c-di-GMP-related signal transduction protein